MFDLGWSELLVIGIVALIVVGPKDLPRMLRTLGQYAARARSVAREFQRSMDEAARQADLDELRQVKKDLDKDVAGLREAQYKLQREMSQSLNEVPKKAAAKAAPAEGAAAPDVAPAPGEPASEPAPPRKVGGA
jgi:sec-independent protein translocase protein TatB